MVMNIELSVRESPRGGAVFRGMRFRGLRAQLEERRIIILVHGFNVDCDHASRTYQKFLDRLQAQVSPTRLEDFGAFIGFHWPGDHPSRIISLLTFPVRMPETNQVGVQLARLITEYLKPHQEVIFIAHSLGCLVVFEALYEIAKEQQHGRQGAAVRDAFLMAAAVPYKDCEPPDGNFRRRDPLRPRDRVIHSEHDWVLRRAFPLGQYQRSPGKGEAVGLHGKPELRWYDSLEADLGHFDYWKSSLVLEKVPKMLDALSPRQLPERPDGSRSGRLPSADIAVRDINVRETGTPLDNAWTVLLEPLSI